jgi:hypothetical protein
MESHESAQTALWGSAVGTRAGTRGLGGAAVTLRNKCIHTICAVAAASLTLFAASSAEAITIGGEDFEKILSVKSHQDFGYWTGADKFYTFQGNDNYIKPINISSVGYRDSSLDGIQFRQVFSMGAVDGDQGPLTMGVVELYGPKNELLLKADYASDGDLSAIYKSGYAGQLNVDGVFTVVDGSLFDSGLVTGLLYIEIAFDYVWQNKYKDLKTSQGTFTFYEHTGGDGPPPPPPPTDIPEPMSMGLLFSGLVGAARLRQKKSE